MPLHFFLGQEKAGRFDNIVGTDFVPFQIRRIFFCRSPDLFTVDDQIRAFDRYVALELAMRRIILEHISQIIRSEKIIDPDNFNVIVLKRSPENEASDAAKPVNTYFYHDVSSYLFLLLFIAIYGIRGSVRHIKYS